jgi:hypothetical protein
MFYQTVIECECDDFAGYHALVIDAADNTCVYITNSFASPADAIRAAEAWLDRMETYHAK